MGINTEMLKVSGPNGEFEAYLAAPDSGPSPGVIVIQEIFGVNDHIRSVTDRLAEAGYAALAPDLFWPHQPGFNIGYTPDDIAVGREIMGKMSLDDAVRDVEATIGVLNNRPESQSGKTGVVGFCWGGLMTYLVSARLQPTCSVPYYGGGIHNFLGESGDINAPILFHFGEADDGIPMDQVDQVKAAVQGKSGATVHTYPGAGHGFNCDARGSFHEASATQAWGRTMEFFGSHLS